MWKLDQNPAVYSTTDTQESSVASSGEEQVLVRLLTGSSVPSGPAGNESSCVERVSNGGDVIAKLLTTSTSGMVPPTVTVSAYVLANVQTGGFRKIEPRPGSEQMKTQETVGFSEDQYRLTSAKRLLDINATRRGVKTCPQCLKKIGYRSKLCKYCYPGKKRLRKPRKLVKPKRVESQHGGVHICASDRQEVSTVDFNSVVVGNETEVSTTEEPVQTATEGPEEIEQTPMSEQVETVTVQDDNATHYLNIPTEDTAHEKNSDDDNCNDATEQPLITDVSYVSQSITSSVKCDESGSVQVLSTEPQTEAATNPSNERVLQQRANLQALICSLLAQTQGRSADVKPERSSKNVVASVKGGETFTTKVETLSDMSLVNTTQLDEGDGLVSQSDGSTKASENGFDANSVALFLGHLAQQNNDKKKLLSPVQAREGSTGKRELKPSSRKPTISYDDSKPIKLRRIEPKVEGDISVETSSESITSKYLEDARVKEKDPSNENRFLTGSATRRGKMLCQKCKNLIGCRSKTCKYCKFTIINDSFLQPRGSTMHQAVALQLPSFMEKSIFSVRKSKSGPDHRCFVRCETFSEGESNTNSKISSKVFSCDFPPCVTLQELGEHPQGYVCEHAKLCRSHSCVAKAAIPLLAKEKQDELPISQDVKDSLDVLQAQCRAQGVAMVQLLSNKTLAVVEQLGANEDNALVTDIVSFVHVRFDKSSTNRGAQVQVFCSGRPCMAWNPVFVANYNSVTKTFSNFRLSSCAHFAACLWAIASDESLDRDFGIYLRAVQSVSDTLCVETHPISGAVVE